MQKANIMKPNRKSRSALIPRTPRTLLTPLALTPLTQTPLALPLLLKLARLLPLPGHCGWQGGPSAQQNVIYKNTQCAVPAPCGLSL